jgi:hypothetical protein
MNNLRRNILQGAGAASAVGVAVMAGLLKPGMALADWNKAGFDAKDLSGALASIGGGGAAASGDIQRQGPGHRRERRRGAGGDHAPTSPARKASPSSARRTPCR